MPSTLLSEDENELWHAWKLTSELVMSAIERDIANSAGLSGADFGVLSRLVDLGGGKLRQQELVTSMRWDKSRLSHQLTRMEGRGLIARRPAEIRGTVVEISRQGRVALAKARPVHAAAVRRHLVARLTREQRKTLLAVCKLVQQEA